MSHLIFKTADEVCIYHSFFCNVLIQLQIALQGRIKNKHVDGNYVVC